MNFDNSSTFRKYSMNLRGISSKVSYSRIQKKVLTLRYVLPIKLGRGWSSSVIAFEDWCAKHVWMRRAMLSFVPMFILAVAFDFFLLAALLSPVLIYLTFSRGVELLKRSQLFLSAYFSLKRDSGSTLFMNEEALAVKVSQTLGVSIDRAKVLTAEKKHSPELVLAEWDQENKLLSYIGSIPRYESIVIDEENFRPRQRNRLQLVLCDRGIAVKKTFAQRTCWYREIVALHALRGLEVVPQLLKADYRQKCLYQSFISGENLGSKLASLGVSVEQQRLLSEEGYKGQNPHLDILRFVLGKDRLGQLRQFMQDCHQRGIALNDVKYGNVILENSGISLCDFDMSSAYPKFSLRFFIQRQKDWQKFNLWFGVETTSYAQYQEQVAQLASKNESITYAPLYIGKGMGSKDVGSIEFGTGKWEFIKKHLPDLSGKNILDMGCNNAMLPMEMLRVGASSVKAFEYDPDVARFAQLNQEMYQLSDNRDYCLDIEVAPMREVLNQSMSNYDVATSFCSLYYEEVPTMAAICRHLSKEVPMFIVQSNESTEEHSGELFEKASMAFLSNLMAKNGYRHQKVVTFGENYNRPLIIGYSDCFS